MKQILLLCTFFALFTFAAIQPAHAQDTDGDSIIDNLDLDSDNDGILDVDEGECIPNPVDFTGLDMNLGASPSSQTFTSDVAGNPLSSDITVSAPVDVSGTTGNGRVWDGGTTVGEEIWFTIEPPDDDDVIRSSFTLVNPETPVFTAVDNTSRVTDADEFTISPTSTVSTNFSWIVISSSLVDITFSGNDIIITGNKSSTAQPWAEFEVYPSEAIESFDITYSSLTTTTINNTVINMSYCESRDTDGDGIPDYLDLDSDNDGIYDSIEAGANAGDLDVNGRITGGVNSDGIPTNANGGNGFTLTDTDSDGNFNPYDIDSDGDSCSDANEYYNRPGADGGDGDGEFGTDTPSDVDANGLVTGATYDGSTLSNVTDSGTSTACSYSLTGGSCWRTLASPNDGSTYADYFSTFDSPTGNFGGLWTQGVSGSRQILGVPNVYTMNAAGNDWEAVSDLGDPFPQGTGVLISVFDLNDEGNSSSGGFPKTSSLQPFLFADQPLSNGNVTVDLGTDPGTSSAQDVTGDEGFSLVSNPYFAAVDFSEVFSNVETKDIKNAAWVYDRNAGGTDVNGNNGGWRSTNGSGVGDIENGIIAPGQAFVVQNTGSPTSPEVRFEGNDVAASGDFTFYGKQNEKPLPDHLRLEVRGESIYNSAWVQFSSDGNAAERIDGDVQQFYPFESEYAVLSTVKQGQLMDIGHFPTPTATDENMRIPLTIETTSTGPMTLELTDLQLPGATLYLHDTGTGEAVELTEGATYSFSAEATIAKAINDCNSAPTGFLGPQTAKQSSPRFYISAEASLNSTPDLPSEFALKQNYPNPFNPTTQITYQLPQQADVRLEVFDMNGRQVATLVNRAISAGTHTVNFDASDLSSGVYMYRLQAGATVMTRKLTLIK